ncbi:unnamed protein product, partial [Hapterophycus canaliculatus]
MDIYADLPSAKPSSDAAVASSPSPAAASKGSWAHSKFQGMIANRRTLKAATSRMAPPTLKRPGPPSAGAGPRSTKSKSNKTAEGSTPSKPKEAPSPAPSR